ncbi:kinase-like domain-containing protein [Thelephora terrestris]|uniref:Kinase-like domain-containing protein n=1 Tax=Thelephora terrestris TaxID=56493 RepID=A0A9P6HNA0_9AGAM|nr:kinase-like domain-containing protein [Thelephora terrestris]
MAAPRNTTYELIHHLARGNIPQTDIPQVLSTIFDAPDHKDLVAQLPEQDLRLWTDRLDQIIDSRICTEELRKQTLRALRKTCGARGILPRSHYFHGRLYKAGNRPVAGGTADVWRVEDDRKRLYAAKVFRVYNGDERKIKRYFKELTVWKRLDHPNVLPAYGAAPDIAEFCAISPWMSEGDLLQYLGKYPGANRHSIMVGVADGLSYLHFSAVVHGDMKGPNILFDNTGVPKISDFGISSITLDPQSYNASTPARGNSLRWTAPEILGALNDESRRPTRMSDVYAFAMVVIEIFTGRHPFPDDVDVNVYHMVMKGKRPSKPVDASRLGLSSAAWKLVEECWHKKRDKRPDMQSVAYRLRRA